MSDAPTDGETALWIALNRSQRKVYREMDQALKAQALPPLHWYDVLWSLERAGRAGKRAFELERSLLFEQSNLSRLLKRMVVDGLVEEAVCTDDRRGKVLLITPEGRRLRKLMWKTYARLIHQSMHDISLRDQQTLIRVLSALAKTD